MSDEFQVGDKVKWSEPSYYKDKPDLQKRGVVKGFREADGKREALVRETTGLRITCYIAVTKLTKEPTNE